MRNEAPCAIPPPPPIRPTVIAYAFPTVKAALSAWVGALVPEKELKSWNTSTSGDANRKAAWLPSQLSMYCPGNGTLRNVPMRSAHGVLKLLVGIYQAGCADFCQ